MNSKLENKALENGFVRLHINDLMKLRSRPVTPNESWFPSKSSDWIRLADGTYGYVLAQTPEMVTLKLKGGALKYYPTADYLAQSPVNLLIWLYITWGGNRWKSVVGDILLCLFN